nr:MULTISPECIES: hypothetical protein [Bacillus]
MKVNCIKCKHYFVTWDVTAPKGCKAFNFKATKIPSLIVLQSSGQACLKYEPKFR